MHVKCLTLTCKDKLRAFRLTHLECTTNLSDMFRIDRKCSASGLLTVLMRL